MLIIKVPGQEIFDDSTSEFISYDDVTLQLEYSLASISKWESIWEKPFLDSKDKSTEETLSYIKCMNVTPDIDDEVFDRFTNDIYERINAHIYSKMTATWFTEKPAGSKEVITSELIYYWMTVLNIPMECENWHLNRLFTLIKVANAKNAPPKKLSAKELGERNRKLNAERQAMYNTKG